MAAGVISIPPSLEVIYQTLQTGVCVIDSACSMERKLATENTRHELYAYFLLPPSCSHSWMWNHHLKKPPDREESFKA